MAGELGGVAAAVLSSTLGGAAVAVTRFMTGTLDPLAIGALRFGIGVAVLLPFALMRRAAWPQRHDWQSVAGLGLLFFAGFPLLFNAALVFTTAARASLSLSTLPLLTLALGAALGAEALTTRKTAGVLLAMTGVALSLLAGLADAPPGAWRGDLLMVGAALCMAFYSVLSRPVLCRCDPLAFTAAAMGVGAPCLAVAALARGSFRPVEALGPGQWAAVLFLGVAGTALAFALWSLALRYTTPTRVAVSVAVNPVSASLAASALLREPVPWTTVTGLATVLAGIGLALTEPGRRDRAEPFGRHK